MVDEGWGICRSHLDNRKPLLITQCEGPVSKIFRLRHPVVLTSKSNIAPQKWVENMQPLGLVVYRKGQHLNLTRYTRWVFFRSCPASLEITVPKTQSGNGGSDYHRMTSDLWQMNGCAFCFSANETRSSTACLRRRYVCGDFGLPTAWRRC